MYSSFLRLLVPLAFRFSLVGHFLIAYCSIGHLHSIPGRFLIDYFCVYSVIRIQVIFSVRSGHQARAFGFAETTSVGRAEGASPAQPRASIARGASLFEMVLAVLFPFRFLQLSPGRFVFSFILAYCWDVFNR